MTSALSIELDLSPQPTSGAPDALFSAEISAAGEPSPRLRAENEARATRLRWLALQLTVFSSAVCGLAWEAGVRFEPGAAQAAASRSDRESDSPAVSSPLPLAWPADDFRIATAPITPQADSRDLFLGMASQRLRARMQAGQVKSLKMNRGGSSISLRVEFADGSRAAFKPQQSNPQTVPRKEAAAYALSRLLGLNLVSPVVMRTLSRDEIFAKLDTGSRWAKKRIDRETRFDAEGQTLGSFSYWIPRVANTRLDTTRNILSWTDWLGQDGELPEGKEPLLAQLSSLLVFDLIQNNSDRFSGGNLLGAPDGKTLYYMDNAFGFQTDPEGHSRCWFYLNRVQKFSRRLVVALETLDRAELAAALSRPDAAGSPQPLLSDEEIDALWARRGRALDYINAQIERYGREKVLVFE